MIRSFVPKTSAATQLANANHEGVPFNLLVQDLYRRCLRAAPIAKHTYDLEQPLPELKKMIRKLFDQHKDVKDPSMNTILLRSGEMELLETQELFKQKTHLLRMLTGDNLVIPSIRIPADPKASAVSKKPSAQNFSPEKPFVADLSKLPKAWTPAEKMNHRFPKVAPY